MQKESILSSDLLDIVFEDRNKAYGAYVLRKYYKNRVIKGLVLSILFVAAVLLLLSTQKKNKREVLVFIDHTMSQVVNEKPVKKEVVKPVEKAKEKPKGLVKKVNAQQFISNMRIVSDDKASKRIQTLNDSSVIAAIDVKGIPGVLPIVKPPTPPTPPGGGDGKKGIDKNVPLLTAEIMPAYPGGMAALNEFLRRNLESPADVNEGESVSVKIKFIVGMDGKLRGFEVLEDGGAAFNNEVIRVLKRMPQWNPGRSNGENVSVYYQIPVKFMPASE